MRLLRGRTRTGKQVISRCMHVGAPTHLLSLLIRVVDLVWRRVSLQLAGSLPLSFVRRVLVTHGQVGIQRPLVELPSILRVLTGERAISRCMRGGLPTN